jgi:WD40 repeat protein
LNGINDEAKNNDAPLPVLACHLDDKAVIYYNEKNGLIFSSLSDSSTIKEIDISHRQDESITGLASIGFDDSSVYLLAAGYSNGYVDIWKIKLPEIHIEKILENKSHKHSVKCITFIDEKRLISGGMDKKLYLLTFDTEGELKNPPEPFNIELRCKGMEIEGVHRAEIEGKLLAEFIDRANKNEIEEN